MKMIDGGVTAPKGFKAAGKHIGVKRKSKDLAIVYSEVPAVAVGSFTTNVVKAAPVLWDKKIVDMNHGVQAIVINSGNANACTGEKGYKDTEQMAQKTAEALDLNSKESVLVCSTGVIGVPLPMEKIEKGIEEVSGLISDSYEAGIEAAEAIMTTDTVKKNIAIEYEYNGNVITIAGMAKGSGMIHPNMATMLSFITTDANISKEILQKLLGNTVEDTYNMISVDGDTSTNDTVLVLANGLSSDKAIEEGTEGFEKFKEAFETVNASLAKSIVKDGEGAGKFIEVKINGAKTKEDAKLMAKSVISSSLVKTAMFGEDANWGRVLCAMGYSGAEFDPMKVTLHFESEKGTILLLENGMPVKFDEDIALEILKKKDILVTAEVGAGEETATAWGCDLSYEYVRINGDYRT